MGSDPDGYTVFPDLRALTRYESRSLKRDDDRNPIPEDFLDACPYCGATTEQEVDGYRTCPNCRWIGVPA